MLKFILTKIGKNLLSGKSILNISLPVDIFAPESNLERLAFAMTYAPIYLERAARESNPVEKFKSVVAFGITNSVLYLNMEKPFNPILGETFQGWMNGCPVYMEQVSHHPPIASFMLLGRGYKMSGKLSIICRKLRVQGGTPHELRLWAHRWCLPYRIRRWDGYLLHHSRW